MRDVLDQIGARFDACVLRATEPRQTLVIAVFLIPEQKSAADLGAVTWCVLAFVTARVLIWYSTLTLFSHPALVILGFTTFLRVILYLYLGTILLYDLTLFLCWA